MYPHEEADFQSWKISRELERLTNVQCSICKETFLKYNCVFTIHEGEITIMCSSCFDSE